MRRASGPPGASSSTTRSGERGEAASIRLRYCRCGPTSSAAKSRGPLAACYDRSETVAKLESLPKKRAQARPERSPRTPSGSEAGLRLAIGPGGLGLEVEHASETSPVRVLDAHASLPGTRFPIDVSGGVARFRHKRGRLERLVVEIRAHLAAERLAPRLAGLVSPSTPLLSLAPAPWGARISLSAPTSPLDPSERRAATLVFEIVAATERGAIRLFPRHARGAHLSAPASALARRATDAIARALGAEPERALTVGAAVARWLFPAAGARVPDAGEIVITTLASDDDGWLLRCERGGRTLEPSADAAEARELSRLTAEVDGALIAHDDARARSIALTALESAPASIELLRRLLEIDTLAIGRAEAARATLDDLQRRGAVRLGDLATRVLDAVGDRPRARAAAERQAELEESPRLAAQLWIDSADRCDDDVDALTFLDRAVAAAPTFAGSRWARIERALRQGRSSEALADAEHVEALAGGPRDKHRVLQVAAELFLREGSHETAAELFDRALRFAPDDPETLAGLGAAFAERGRHARAAALLASAVDKLDADSEADAGPARVRLARVLAESMGNHSAAIARVREVRPTSAAALEARLCEARWRAELGDLSGATLAYARMRELDMRSERAVRAYEEAAAHAERLDDRPSASRYLLDALALAPGDAGLRAAYRRVVGAPPAAPNAPTATAHSGADSPAPLADADASPALDDATSAIDDDVRAEELIRKLHADPTDNDVVDELSDVLMRLSRGHELFALLAARLEDATPERRNALIPRQRAVLEKLEREAETLGRPDEAALFALARQSLEPSS